MAEGETARGTASFFVDEGEWAEYPAGTAYNCEIYLSQEGDTIVAAAALPGVVGRGASAEAAVEEAKSGAAKVIRQCKVAGQPIPWAKRQPQDGEVVKTVVVQV